MIHGSDGIMQKRCNSKALVMQLRLLAVSHILWQGICIILRVFPKLSTLRPRRNEKYFSEDIFKRIYLKKGLNFD